MVRTFSSIAQVSNSNAIANSYLVNIGGKSLVVTANTRPVHKGDSTQFWFYHEGKQMLAVRGKHEYTFTAK